MITSENRHIVVGFVQTNLETKLITARNVSLARVPMRERKLDVQDTEAIGDVD